MKLSLMFVSLFVSSQAFSAVLDKWGSTEMGTGGQFGYYSLLETVSTPDASTVVIKTIHQPMDCRPAKIENAKCSAEYLQNDRLVTGEFNAFRCKLLPLERVRFEKVSSDQEYNLFNSKEDFTRWLANNKTGSKTYTTQNQANILIRSSLYSVTHPDCVIFE